MFSKYNNWFGLVGITSARFKTIGLYVRFFGLDTGIYITANPQEWTLITVSILDVESTAILRVQIVGVGVFFGRNRVLFSPALQQYISVPEYPQEGAV
jgi:hypothetical protein